LRAFLYARNVPWQPLYPHRTLAFTQDGISYIGTDSRDSLVLTTGVGTWEFPTGGPAFIEALGDDDLVTFNGNAAEVTLVAGDGADVTVINNGGVNVTGQLASSSINGNGGDDTTTWNNITNTSIYGGQGDDTLGAFAGNGGLTTNASEIQGNKGDDSISLTGAVTFTTVYGGRDNDLINFGGEWLGRDQWGTVRGFGNNIQGNKGDDTINVEITGAGSSGNEVYGGQDNDLINAYWTPTSVLLSGDKGFDTIVGGVGGGAAQTLSGGDDEDKLIFSGNDATTMNGGEGGDTFRFNALSSDTGIDAPFVEDFNTLEDSIQINIDAYDASGNPFNTSGTWSGAGGFTGFFGPTSQGSSGIYVGDAGIGSYPFIAAQFLNTSWGPVGVPTSVGLTSLAALEGGQLTNGMLFKEANLGQLVNRIDFAAELRDEEDSKFAIGFTEDDRKLYMFTGIRAFETAGGDVDYTWNTNVVAQFATNNISGTDIYLV
jgi:hypothetical protein